MTLESKGTNKLLKVFWCSSIVSPKPARVKFTDHVFYTPGFYKAFHALDDIRLIPFAIDLNQLDRWCLPQQFIVIQHDPWNTNFVEFWI